MISFAEAYQLTLRHCHLLDSEWVKLIEATGRVVTEPLHSLVDSPSVDASLKDGYAVKAADVESATPEQPVTLNLAGRVAAGGAYTGQVTRGHAIRILTGAPIPQGAESVVSDEYASDDGVMVTVRNDAESGRNILWRGSDVATGQLIVTAGSVLRPTVLGLLAAAGHSQVPVVRRPRVALIATGDEVIAPGHPLPEGKLYASNLVTLDAWCHHFGFETTTRVVPDDEESIRGELIAQGENCDALITCGGAWKGDRDLVAGLLDELGWTKVFHRVRLGPGKAVGFGLYRGKPVFCLPGGPPSNQMAFLQLALPGLQRLAGEDELGLPRARATLAKKIGGQAGWTECVHGRLIQDGSLVFQPMRMKSRLQEMAQTEGIAMIPEGIKSVQAGQEVVVQLFPGVTVPRSTRGGEGE